LVRYEVNAVIAKTRPKTEWQMKQHLASRLKNKLEPRTLEPRHPQKKHESSRAHQHSTRLLGAREGLGETEQSLAMETNIAAMAPVPRGKDESSLSLATKKPECLF
jgi:hypothetical protein